MSLMYHGIPEQMQGANLIPLNQMHALMPDLYERYAQKYVGREAVMQRRIPLLDCLWNDVVQFLPVHPQKIFDLQVQFGLIPAVPPYRFYEIDTAQLDPGLAVVYFKSEYGGENAKVAWLHDVEYDSIQTIPSATVDYYRTLIGTGELPFNYQFVLHVLYKGSVDIVSAKEIVLQ